MGHVVRVTKWGRGLGILLPLGYCRELAIRRRDYLLLERGQGPRIVVRKIEPADAAAEPRR